jgi:flagellar hook assembly protein FlgD
VSIDIYNLKGQLVRSYQPGSQPAGKYQIVFDGMDQHGQAVASGVYFYRLKTADKQLQRKMILMK